jgi:hypothetical protein
MKNPTLEKKQLKARISYNFYETVIKVINAPAGAAPMQNAV